MTALDNPVWASLNGPQTALAEGGALAKRYRPDVNFLAGLGHPTGDALAALVELVRPGETIYLPLPDPVECPQGLELVRTAPLVQMVWNGPSRIEADPADIVPLGPEDAAEMLALARLTEPGPFAANTRLMGSYYGIRIEGRLASMAGERMRPTGYTEVSAVCTHPDFRGRGLAGRLLRRVGAGILARGQLPFLHVWKSNALAIAIYEREFYAYRRDLLVTILSRPMSGDSGPGYKKPRG